MKTIIIYPTVIKLPEGLTLKDLNEIQGFKNLLNKDITPDCERKLIERCQQYGIDVHHIVAPDGFLDETLISRDAFQMILEAANGEDGAYSKYFNMPAPELPGIDVEEFNQKIIPLFNAAQRLGIALQIKTCYDEDFRMLSKEEAERFAEEIDENSMATLRLSKKD